MGKEMNVQLRISPAEAKRGCTKKFRANGMQIAVNIPAGATNGQVLNLWAVPFPTGPQNMTVTVKVSRSHTWVWIGLVLVVLWGFGQMLNPKPASQTRPESSRPASAAANVQPADSKLDEAIRQLYQTPVQTDTAAARVEAELMKLGSWEYSGGSGPRGTGVIFTAPDMAALMDEIQQQLEQGQLTADSPEAVCELILQRLQQGAYSTRRTSVVVKYTEQDGIGSIVQTEQLADAVYGGLLTWQEEALAQWREENP